MTIYLLYGQSISLLYHCLPLLLPCTSSIRVHPLSSYTWPTQYYYHPVLPLLLLLLLFYHHFHDCVTSLSLNSLQENPVCSNAAPCIWCYWANLLWLSLKYLFDLILIFNLIYVFFLNLLRLAICCIITIMCFVEEVEATCFLYY